MAYESADSVTEPVVDWEERLGNLVMQEWGKSRRIHL